jgi:hypothetical protein
VGGTPGSILAMGLTRNSHSMAIGIPANTPTITIGYHTAKIGTLIHR